MFKSVSIRDIIGVYDYMSDTKMGEPLLPVQYQETGIEDAQFDRWVEAYKPKYRKPLSQLKDAITHVSHTAFTQALKDTVFQFNHYKMQMEDFCCICLVQPGKSQKWVTEIARKLDFKAREYFCLGEQGADGLEFALKSVSHEHAKYFRHIAIIDDGSFSGNQMANNISRAHDILRRKFGESSFFHILIPYVTETAHRRIRSLSELGIKINLYHSEIMPVVASAVNRRALPLLMDVLWPKATEFEKQQKTHTTALYWFDHKIPNEMSFPYVVTHGIVTRPAIESTPEESMSFRFLPNVHPPYKQV